MRHSIVIAFALLLAMFQGATLGEDKPAKDKKAESAVEKLMKAKLHSSQVLLEGLATEDYAKITENAQKLLEISKAAEFSAFKTREYEIQTNNFRRAAELIIAKAKAKNIDGVTLGYVDMTVTCVRCHQYTRDIRNSRAPREEDGSGVGR